MLIIRVLPSLSRQWTFLPLTLVKYTGWSSVRIIPLSLNWKIIVNIFVHNYNKIVIHIYYYSHPCGRAYFIWLRVEYTNIPASSHAPLLILMVSWIKQLCSNVLLAMVIANNNCRRKVNNYNKLKYSRSYFKNVLCLLKRATWLWSEDHTIYLTGGVLISATVWRCWISYRITEVGVLRSKRLPLPALNISLTVAGGLTDFVVALDKSRISIC
jgi:hypothetical protein